MSAGRDDTLSEAQVLSADERLAAWVDDIIIGRYEAPHYANPGELKRDIRTLLAEVVALRARVAAAETEREIARIKGLTSEDAQRYFDERNEWADRAEAAESRVAAVLRERDEASVEQLREHVRAAAAESRCKELEQERDEAQRILSERIIGGRSFSTLVSEWLSANEKTPDQVLHGMFPLGMVGRWVERAEAAESRCRQLETAINDFFQRTGDHPRVCWDSFCGGGSHTALCSATSRLYASRAALVSAENGQT